MSVKPSSLVGWNVTTNGDQILLQPKTAAGVLSIVHTNEPSTQRLKIAIPKNFRVSVLEEGIGGPCEIEVESNAHLEWVRWQHEVKEHTSEQKIRVAEGARLNWTGVQFGCEALRAPVDVQLTGENASAHLHGLSFVQAKEVVQNDIRVEHLAPHTESSQLFKSVLRDQAKSTFAGKIVIRQQAQKSDAKQRHQSLNFHSSAQSITQPELEVEADDVKAAHGATVGRLNEEELFYLETRGISRDEGMALLARAFVQEVLSVVKTPLVYQFIDEQLGERIGEFLKAMESRSDA